MIRVGVGQSQRTVLADALEDAATIAMGNAQLAKADLAVVFATVDYQSDYGRLFHTIHDVSGCDHLVGCSGVSVLTSAGEVEDEPAVAVLVLRSDDVSAMPFLVSSDDSSTIGAAIRERISPKLHENSLLVVLPDVRCISPEALVHQIGEDGSRLPVVGAAASGSPNGEYTYAWHNGEVVEAGIAGMLLTGAFHTEIGVAQGCQPIGHPLEITRAEGNVIYEVDGKPAFNSLQGALESLTAEDIRQSGRVVFIGIAMDKENPAPQCGDFLVRNLVGYDRESAAIAVSEHVSEGQLVQFHLRNSISAKKEIKEIVLDLHERTRENPPAFGMYFNCLGRGKGLYGEANHDVQIIKQRFPDLPVIGFFGNAEFAPIGGRNFAHSYTGALVLCSEG
jgi:small ligand-binding sensory domain FIST